MTNLPTTAVPGPEEPPAGGEHKLAVTIVVTALVLLGLSVLVALWLRRGGARTVITELAEQGAVRLADKVVDEVLGAA